MARSNLETFKCAAYSGEAYSCEPGTRLCFDFEYHPHAGDASNSSADKHFLWAFGSILVSHVVSQTVSWAAGILARMTALFPYSKVSLGSGVMSRMYVWVVRVQLQSIRRALGPLNRFPKFLLLNLPLVAVWFRECRPTSRTPGREPKSFSSSRSIG